MKTYNKYKDSGIPWIGQVPAHWEIATLRKYLRFVSIKNHPQEQLLSVTREQGVIIRDVESKESNHNFIPEDLSNYKYVERGWFVINKMKSWQGSYAVSNFQGIVSPAYYVCKLAFENKVFFSKAIRSRAYVHFFTQYSKGIRTDQWDLSALALKSIPFFCPPESEQRTIVAFLDNATNKIDKYIAIKEQEIEKLQLLKQSIIADAVTRGLNSNAPMKDSGIPWLGQVPEHWGIRKIKNLFVERCEKNHPDEEQLCATQSHGVIPQRLYNNRVVVVNKGFEGLKLVDIGDFVISLRSFQGGIEYAYYRGIISAAYTILSLKTQDLKADYVKYLFKSHAFIQLLKSCVIGIREGQNINYDLLRKQALPVPPADEQRAIVVYLEEKIRKIGDLITNIQSELDKLKFYKQRLIADAVTGKFKVEA